MAYHIGIFGSAFNPPTRGHQDVIQQAASVCEHIVLVPSFKHAFAKKMLDFESRLKLTQIFSEECTATDCKVTVTDIEKHLFTNRPSVPVYTYDLMNAMQQHFNHCRSDNQLIFIRGPDNANPAVWSRFYRYKDIEAKWQIFTATEQMSIRSSSVRKILADNQEQQQKHAMLADFLTPEVLQSIFTQGLFMSEHDTE
ncbi:MAG: adenylyltransferase/cytidyltransferase family protein [Endozoicomonadaceae bacterium]|nr:adenylyltransferase/cytidyltransferase family protein [Endozoicomonadaceae bacterium]